MELSKVEALTPLISELQMLKEKQEEDENLVAGCRRNLKDAEDSLAIRKLKIISVKVRIEKI